MQQSISTPSRIKRRGLGRPISASQIDEIRFLEILEIGRETVSDASSLPLDEEASEEFDRIYSPSAQRLTDPRIWSLVGGQLLAWLTHIGGEASKLAISRGDVAIRIGDLQIASRETHKISCSPYCPPDEP